MIYCVTCGAEHRTLNPIAWLEHMTNGGHIFHPASYVEQPA